MIKNFVLKFGVFPVLLSFPLAAMAPQKGSDKVLQGIPKTDQLFADGFVDDNGQVLEEIISGMAKALNNNDQETFARMSYEAARRGSVDACYHLALLHLKKLHDKLESKQSKKSTQQKNAKNNANKKMTLSSWFTYAPTHELPKEWSNKLKGLLLELNAVRNWLMLANEIEFVKTGSVHEKSDFLLQKLVSPSCKYDVDAYRFINSSVDKRSLDVVSRFAFLVEAINHLGLYKYANKQFELTFIAFSIRDFGTLVHRGMRLYIVEDDFKNSLEPDQLYEQQKLIIYHLIDKILSSPPIQGVALTQAKSLIEIYFYQRLEAALQKLIKDPEHVLRHPHRIYADAEKALKFYQSISDNKEMAIGALYACNLSGRHIDPIERTKLAEQWYLKAKNAEREAYFEIARMYVQGRFGIDLTWQERFKKAGEYLAAIGSTRARELAIQTLMHGELWRDAITIADEIFQNGDLENAQVHWYAYECWREIRVDGPNEDVDERVVKHFSRAFELGHEKARAFLADLLPSVQPEVKTSQRRAKNMPPHLPSENNHDVRVAVDAQADEKTALIKKETSSRLQEHASASFQHQAQEVRFKPEQREMIIKKPFKERKTEKQAARVKRFVKDLNLQMNKLKGHADPVPLGVAFLNDDVKNDFKSSPYAMRLRELIDDIKEDPRALGRMGRAERLHHSAAYAGCFSRRINIEHRLVYSIENDNTILIRECNKHYPRDDE